MAESDEEQWSLASQGRVLCQQYVIARSLKAGAQLKKIRCVSLMAQAFMSGQLRVQKWELSHLNALSMTLCF